MPDVPHVGLQDGDKILTFNGETGALTPLEISTAGRRSAAVLAVPLGG